MALNGNPDETNGYHSVTKNGVKANANFVKSMVPPIGSVISWLKNLGTTHTPTLPDGWVECNGQTLSDSDSPYNGDVIPNLNGTVAETDTASGGSSNTIVKGTAAWSTNQWVGYYVRVLTGTGAIQTRRILSNTATTITVDQAWYTNPVASDTFEIRNPQRFLRGSATSGNTDGGDTISWSGSAYHQNGSSGSNAWPNIHVHSTDDAASTVDSYACALPSFYEVVWIMRVK